MTSADLTEGWGVIRPGDRRAHYYRDMTALCRRVGFYTGPLERDESPSKDDCAACRKALEREKAAVRRDAAMHRKCPECGAVPLGRCQEFDTERVHVAIERERQGYHEARAEAS